MPELGQLDLQFALPGFGTLSEDVQDQARTVQNPALECLLQVALLNGGQRMVENDQLPAVLFHGLAHLLQLPLADESRGIRSAAYTANGVAHARTGAPCQQRELQQRISVLVRAGTLLDKQRPFGPPQCGWALYRHRCFIGR
jgi:hypothetical protein